MPSFVTIQNWKWYNILQKIPSISTQDNARKTWKILDCNWIYQKSPDLKDSCTELMVTLSNKNGYSNATMYSHIYTLYFRTTALFTLKSVIHIRRPDFANPCQFAATFSYLRFWVSLILQSMMMLATKTSCDSNKENSTQIWLIERNQNQLVIYLRDAFDKMKWHDSQSFLNFKVPPPSTVHNS